MILYFFWSPEPLSILNTLLTTCIFFCPVGEVAHAEETVHTDHPAGPKGEGELPEGEEQPTDDASAGEMEKHQQQDGTLPLCLIR